MATATMRLASAFLRYAAPFARLRDVPVLGKLLRFTSQRLVARDTLIWIQVQHGPAAGLWTRVNPRTGNAIFLGRCEPRVQQAFADHLRPGMTCYDLGANIGFFSLMAARLVGPAGHVFAFEADPEIAARLRENIAYNRFTQASVEQQAVWSAPATVSFARADVTVSADRGVGHVLANGDSSSNVISVQADSLDHYCVSHPAPDFIKCDVEGAECEVFRGAAELLRTRHPIVVCELHSAQDSRELCRTFLDLGYDCSALDENHILALPG